MYVIKAGGMVYPFKYRTAQHKQAIVEEHDIDGNFMRVVEKAEWSEWPGRKAPPQVLKKPVAKKKVIKKKKPAKVEPDEDTSLENIDVSSI